MGMDTVEYNKYSLTTLILSLSKLFIRHYVSDLMIIWLIILRGKSSPLLSDLRIEFVTW